MRNINPDAQALGEIAVETAKTAEMFGIDPKVAMLSFSTKGSAASEEVAKVAEATKIAQELAPDYQIDGELQFDAAFVESVAKQKAPDSDVAGHANVFVFPEIQSGNIGYKIAQRFGGFEAIGPILQGLNKPISDLSRGCSEDDVYMLSIITAAQFMFDKKNTYKVFSLKKWTPFFIKGGKSMWHLQNEVQLQQVGEYIGRYISPQSTLVLTGELGTGKTTMTKGIAKGLGIERVIKSPTYTIIREYTEGRMPLYHMDVYRLEDGDGEELGLEEYYEDQGLVIMEWGHNLEGELPSDYLDIQLVYPEVGEGRYLSLTVHGSKLCSFTETLQQWLDEEMTRVN